MHSQPPVNAIHDEAAEDFCARNMIASWVQQDEGMLASISGYIRDIVQLEKKIT